MHELIPPPNEGAPARILVVDDEAHVRELLARWLREAGYECQSANGVSQALQILALGRVDLVTTDINMPEESGSDWVPRLRQAYPDMALVVLTGCDDARMAIQAFEDGVCGYLIKPVSQAEFVDQVDRAVQQRQWRAGDRSYTCELERRIEELTRCVEATHEEMADRLMYASAVHQRDQFARLRRIGLMTAVVAGALNRSREEIAAIRRAAPLHDIGRSAPTDRQRDDEFTCDRAITEHALVGAGILTGSQALVLQMAEQIARWHHERWDGSGLPDGLRGEQIPWAARIVAVIDAYEASRHQGEGSAARRDEEALRVVENGAGTSFDPEVVQAFCRVWPRLRQPADHIEFEHEVTDQPELCPAECATSSLDDLAALVV